MSFSYKPLWGKAMENNLNKTQLRDKAGITNASLARLSKNENVSMETLYKLCKCLNCEVSDIVKYIDSRENKSD